MEFAVTIGLDLGMSVFQVHGVDAGGAVVKTESGKWSTARTYSCWPALAHIT